MKNSKKILKIVSIMLFIAITITNIVSAKTIAPEYVRFSLEKGIQDRVYFDGFYVEVQRIRSDVGVAYCLEVNKNYPGGESFVLEGEVNELTKKVLAVGYPNINIEDLQVDTGDEAYTATQVALWSMIEGYNVSNIRGDNPKVIKCIKDICEKSVNADVDTLMKDVKSYYFNDKVQRVGIVMDKVDVVPPTTEPPIGK